MSIESKNPIYAQFADALLMESLQKYRMPEVKKEVNKEEEKEGVIKGDLRMNLEAIAIEQENL